MRDIEFIPIGISYEKVVEEHAHIKELMGEGKKKPSLPALLSAARWVLSVDFGRINVQFGSPISIRQFTETAVHQLPMAPTPSPLIPVPMPLHFVDNLFHDHDHDHDHGGNYHEASDHPRHGHPQTPGPSSSVDAVAMATAPPLDPYSNLADRRRVVVGLAYHISRELRDNCVCMSTALLASLLLAHRHTGLSREEATEGYAWLSERITERGGWVDPILQPLPSVILRAERLLGSALVAECGGLGRLIPAPQGGTVPSQWMHLCYYASHVLHVFQHEAIIACALASFGYQRIIPTLSSSPPSSSSSSSPFNVPSSSSSPLSSKDCCGVDARQVFSAVDFLDDMLRFEFIPPEHSVMCLLYRACIHTYSHHLPLN